MNSRTDAKGIFSQQLREGLLTTMNSTSFRRKLRLAEKHLCQACDRLSAWVEASGKCQLEPVWDREPMESLVRAIAHQQLHARAAEAILGRLLAKFPKTPFPTARQLLKLQVTQLREMGFSLAKAEAILGIADAAKTGLVPSRLEAEQLDNEELIERLTRLRGIGQWTVEMFLIFSLGRLDIMPRDDFGVRAGLMHLYQLDEMPKKKAFGPLTDHWSPYRSIGAWYLWRMADANK